MHYYPCGFNMPQVIQHLADHISTINGKTIEDGLNPTAIPFISESIGNKDHHLNAKITNDMPPSSSNEKESKKKESPVSNE